MAGSPSGFAFIVEHVIRLMFVKTVAFHDRCYNLREIMTLNKAHEIHEAWRKLLHSRANGPQSADEMLVAVARRKRAKCKIGLSC